ncbi:MAG: sugar ABC transporter ATP-binding protein [Thermomicrobiales bacterium]|nr:sugar ABC transporter ATP-binding protein [Thermomicrobiales bacterium]
MPVLSAERISKRFGGVVALDEASFSCEPGEIHALLGGNGAGKSTMVKILCGVQPADSGTITLAGEPVTFASPRAAIARGVVPVFQELSLVPDLTVAENLFLNREPRRLGFVDRGSMRRETSALLARYGFPAIDPNVVVRDLPLADRQLVEIAKAMSRDPKVLILDEATSALGGREVQHLFDVLRGYRDLGKSIIFISHRMDEVRDFCDRATVFRDGVDVGTIDVDRSESSEIVRMMIGRQLQDVFPPRPARPAAEKPRLSVENLTWAPALQDVSFHLNEGEILGLAGLDGQGQGDLLLSLFGVYAGTSGVVRMDGEQLSLNGPRGVMARKAALIPEDRKTQGLILPLSVRENIALPVLPELSTLSVVRQSVENNVAGNIIRQLSIKTPSMHAVVGRLSGGNQQKVAIGKWLVTKANVYLMYDPTRGIDVGTKQEIYQLMRELATNGASILFFSTDSEEIIGLCDRALVMFEGRVVQELGPDQLDKEHLMAASLGLVAPEAIPA